jgi:hypothetical protein
MDFWTDPTNSKTKKVVMIIATILGILLVCWISQSLGRA